jgi:Polysaccharide lyase/Bacterial Ig domain
VIAASDPDGIARVVFYVGGKRFDEERESPYECDLDTTRLPDGAHRLTAVAWDRRGDVGRSAVDVNVDNGAASPAAPAPDAFAADASALFADDFSTGDMRRWTEVQQSAPGRVSVSSSAAGAVGRFEIRGGEQRAEVYKDLRFSEGTDRLFTWRTSFASGFPAEGKWQLVWQLHHAGRSGSPPLQLDIAGDSAPGRFVLRGNDRNWGPRYWDGPRIQFDRWYELAIRVHHSTDPAKGFVEVWLDGAPQILANGGTRMYGPTLYDSYNYPKLGYYRSQEMNGTGVVFHDNYVISAAR